MGEDKVNIIIIISSLFDIILNYSYIEGRLNLGVSYEEVISFHDVYRYLGYNHYDAYLIQATRWLQLCNPIC
ncbi:hypothetical protein HB162lentus_26650 [Mammaliicoccus lentus]